MMGVNSCSHFFAWFIECAIFLTLTVSILVLILKAGKILILSNGFILFLFFLDYSLTVIAMSFLISVFFHNTNVAGLSGSLIYIITFFPFIVVVSREGSLSFAGKTLLVSFALFYPYFPYIGKNTAKDKLISQISQINFFLTLLITSCFMFVIHRAFSLQRH